jgi:hypothetical protein
MARRKNTPAPVKGGGYFWSIMAAWVTLLVILVVTAGCVAEPSDTGQPAESYSVCVSEPYAYANAPCVVPGQYEGQTDGYTWVTQVENGSYVGIPMDACAREDGPAPCVWARGAEFVMVRD